MTLPAVLWFVMLCIDFLSRMAEVLILLITVPAAFIADFVIIVTETLGVSRPYSHWIGWTTALAIGYLALCTDDLSGWFSSHYAKIHPMSDLTAYPTVYVGQKLVNFLLSAFEFFLSTVELCIALLSFFKGYYRVVLVLAVLALLA